MIEGFDTEDTGWSPRPGTRKPRRVPAVRGRGHRTRREFDEIACSCGKRWQVGETHP